jgi:hypothetical protein
MRKSLTMSLAASLVTACGLFAGVRGAESGDDADMTIEQVPQAVRDALLAQAGGEPIAAITREVDDGVTLYKARIEQKGIDRRLTVTERGAVVSDRRFEGVNEAWSKAADQAREAKERVSALGGAGDQLRLDQLPDPAQQKLRQEAGNDEVVGIHGRAEGGKILYRARVRRPDGDERLVTVSEDGDVVSVRDDGKNKGDGQG